jgi:hypothetical protein
MYLSSQVAWSKLTALTAPFPASSAAGASTIPGRILADPELPLLQTVKHNNIFV